MSDHITDGDLQALIDGALDTTTQDTLMQRIRDDETLAARYERLQQDTEAVRAVLTTLAPPEPANRHRALARLERKQEMRFKTMSRRNQRIFAGVAAVLVVVIALAFQPVRAFASDVLGLFRVESFAIVNVDPERFEEIANAVDENMYFGEASFDEDANFEPIIVASLDEAAELVGFAPLKPADAMMATEIAVSEGYSATFTPELETLQAVFSTLGLDPDLLPTEMDGQPFTVHVEDGVAAYYVIDYNDILVGQMLSPTVDVPDGVDFQELGVAMLQLLGMSEREAKRLANEIDFATTLVLPIPSGSLASVSEVEVNGNSGLLFEGAEWERYEADDNYEAGEGSMLIWQEDGYLFMVGSDTASSLELLAIAESLR